MENINNLIEYNLNFIKNKQNSRTKRLELKNLSGITLSTSDCILLHKILIEESLVSESENKDLFLTSLSEKILINGGWLKHIETEKIKEQFSAEKEQIDFEKSKVDLELAKKMLKEYPYTKWLARIGAFIGIVLGLKELGMLLKKWLLL